MNRITRITGFVLAVLLFVGSTTVGASAATRVQTTHIGIVNASALRLRSGPSTKSSTLSTAPRGDYVTITGKSGSWYKVEFNLREGYMHQDYLTTSTVKNVELGYGKLNANKVNVRSGPGTGYSSLARANSGDKAYIIGFNNRWYKVIFKSHIGYIRSDYVDLTEIPYENAASGKKPLFFVDGKSTGIKPSADALNDTVTPPVPSLANAIISDAKTHLGTPYVWGGTTPSGFDCSGLVRYVFMQNGITLPRTTTEQYTVGNYVSKSDLKPGDLVFLQNTYREGISHVGIYIGDGQMIHASSSKGVVISNLSSSYYVKHYYGARRVI